MLRRTRALRTLAAVVCATAGVSTVDAQPQHEALTAPMRLAAPVRPVKGAASVYIVKLKAPVAVSYRGNVSALGATKPNNGGSAKPSWKWKTTFKPSTTP